MRIWRKLAKYFFETSYWTWKRMREGRLGNAHYEAHFTAHFDLDRSFYIGKRILDIGCGPRGSLEWADMSVERVGLDPLVPAYRRLGINKHKMSYAAAPSERIPFPSGHFDVVSSINSLDHVNDLDQTIREIKRVLAPGGTFLLLVDVHPEPTLCEPTTFGWNVVDKFAPELELLTQDQFEKAFPSLSRNLRAAPAFDHADAQPRHGILRARFRKPASGAGPAPEERV